MLITISIAFYHVSYAPSYIYTKTLISDNIYKMWLFQILFIKPQFSQFCIWIVFPVVDVEMSHSRFLLIE